MNASTQKRYSRHVSVPSHDGLRVDKAVVIQRPVAEVFSYWKRLENLPRFMSHVESVTVEDDTHSHWKVKTLGGKCVEWDAEIIDVRENEMISWRSIPGSEINNAGSVWFSALPDGKATEVRVALKYVPPGGTAGAILATLFGNDAETEIEEDLNRLKSLLESGQAPRGKA